MTALLATVIAAVLLMTEAATGPIPEGAKWPPISPPQEFFSPPGLPDGSNAGQSTAPDSEKNRDIEGELIRQSKDGYPTKYF
jgi:hypothetical protein